MRRIVVLVSLVIAATGCTRPGGSTGPEEAPRYVLGVSAGPEFTVLGGTFPAPAAVAWRDGPCTATRLREGREPPNLEVNRIDYWVVAGAPIGSARRRPEGSYQAVVRGNLATGTRLAAEIQGSPDVPGHRWRTPARVPTRIRRSAPTAGFSIAPGADLALAWQGGDSSHVALSVTLDGGDAARGDGWLIGCVVPRAPGRFVVPAAALHHAAVPAGARMVAVAVVAADRAREGDYALDVSPLATDDDVVRGTIGPTPSPTPAPTPTPTR